MSNFGRLNPGIYKYVNIWLSCYIANDYDVVPIHWNVWKKIGVVNTFLNLLLFLGNHELTE